MNPGQLAERIALSGQTRQPVGVIEAILRAHSEGDPLNRIAYKLQIHHSSVKKILKAAEDPRLPQTAVGVEDGGGEGPLWRADWSGNEGTIATGAVPDDFDPHNFDEVLSRMGYAPGEIGMELVSASRWEQRSAVRDEDGRRTGETVSTWLNAYKYRAVRSALCVNLPALYEEVRRSRPGRTEPKPTGRSAVVMFGDLQCGKVDHLGGLEEMLHRLEDKRSSLEKYLKKSSVDHVVVADVGDIVEGFENIPSQIRTNCLSLMDQVDIAATEFWKTIRVCERFAPVDVLSVPSNHGQWRRGKSLVGKPTDDWGLHISQRLERLNEEAGLRVAFHRPNEWEEALSFRVRNTVLGVAHGHQASRPEQVSNSWFPKMTHGGVMDCQILLTGHFHYFSMRPSGKTPDGRSRWHIQSPTLDNGSSWVRNKYGEDGEPGLCVFIIDDDGLNLEGLNIL